MCLELLCLYHRTYFYCFNFYLEKSFLCLLAEIEQMETTVCNVVQLLITGVGDETVFGILMYSHVR